MLKIALAALLPMAFLGAQTPDLTGVWKADLSQSKIPGPPDAKPTSYLSIIERKPEIVNRRTKATAPAIVDTTGVVSQRGEHRSVLTVFENGTPFVRPYEGVPTKLTASSEGSVFTVKGEVAGRPETFTRTYRLSSDGNALTVTTKSEHDGHATETVVEMTRQPASAADPLRAPERRAADAFKNVKTDALKSLPASEFIDQMHYFAYSLNRDCQFCHVEHHFDSDEKEEKKTARKMIDMAAAINVHYFDGHVEVRCFTCHEGHAHPLGHPQFPEEAAAEKARMEHPGGEHAPPPPNRQ